jgi:hypothetical protein
VNTRTSNPRNALESLLHRLAVTGPARVRVWQGTSAKIGPGSGALSSRRLMFAILAAILTALAFTATPALAAEASCAGLPEPERAHEEQLRVENNSTQLPDCRAYELVSPANKSGGIADVLAREYYGQYLRPMQATPEGDAITYGGEAFSQARAGAVDQYVSTRTTTGWSTLNISPPASENANLAEVVGASTDLSTFLVASQRGPQLSSAAPASYRNIYFTDGSQASLVPLITHAPPARSVETFGQSEAGEPSEILFAPASEGLSRVYFGANAALTEDAPAGGVAENNLYKWTAGSLHLVNLEPDGVAEPGATFGGEYRLHSADGLTVPDLEHAVSANGMRAFWTDERDHDLYLRESYFEGSEERERTLLVGEDADFLAADKEGTAVFMTKEGELYEYEVPTRMLLDLTPSTSTEVQGVVGLSEDGEYIYFVADGALVPGASTGNCVPTAAEEAMRCNLYLDHDGAIIFVAALSGKDNAPSNEFEPGEEVGKIADWTPEVWARQAEASPDGEFLAFGSYLPLTGQTNEGPEIYVYDAATHALSCASCTPDGASNKGAELPSFGDSYGLYEPRYMLNDGRLFFTTKAPLVPQDTNDEKDVYEYEPEGVGTCTSTAGSGFSVYEPVRVFEVEGRTGEEGAGCLQLISSGGGRRPSVFAEASESGENVFFTTSQQLVPEDQDEITDMYDAREGGGFTAPVVPQCGSSGECQGGLPSPLVFGAPSSVALSGSGNVAPAVASSKGTTEPLTRAQKLAKALKACKKEKRSRKGRESCERQARRWYEPKTRKGAAKKADKRGGSR